MTRRILPIIEYVMTELSRQDPLSIVEARITAMHAPAAEQIADAVAGGNFPNGGFPCVVTGPYQSGKSTSLIPETVRILTERGMNVEVAISGFEESVEASIGYGIENSDDPRPRVLILDEASADVRGHEAEIIEFFRGKGFGAIIPVIAHDISRSTETVVREDMAKWRQAVPEQQGELPVISVGPVQLDPELARDYLEASGTPPECVGQILSTLGRNNALYLPILDTVRYCMEPNRVDDTLRRNMNTWRSSLPAPVIASLEGQVSA